MRNDAVQKRANRVDLGESWTMKLEFFATSSVDTAEDAGSKIWVSKRLQPDPLGQMDSYGDVRRQDADTHLGPQVLL